jgi:hypothetical protein
VEEAAGEDAEDTVESCWFLLADVLEEDAFLGLVSARRGVSKVVEGERVRRTNSSCTASRAAKGDRQFVWWKRPGGAKGRTCRPREGYDNRKRNNAHRVERNRKDPRPGRIRRDVAETAMRQIVVVSAHSSG